MIKDMRLIYFSFPFFPASKVKRPSQTSGKITVKAKEKSYSKLEIPYQTEVLEGYEHFLFRYLKQE